MTDDPVIRHKTALQIVAEAEAYYTKRKGEELRKPAPSAAAVVFLGLQEQASKSKTRKE